MRRFRSFNHSTCKTVLHRYIEVMCSVVYCRRCLWSDALGWHRVCHLGSLIYNQSVQHRHVQCARRHQRRRNGQSMWHRRLPRRSTAVHRRQDPRHLASVSRWSYVRQVAVDYIWRAVTDVTSSSRDVTVVFHFTPLRHAWRTTAACCRVADVRQFPVPQRWNDARFFPCQPQRHVGKRVARSGEFC